MNARFFDRDGTDFVAIRTDGSTVVELAVTDAHKARYRTAWADYEAQKAPKKKPVKRKPRKSTKKAK